MADMTLYPVKETVRKMAKAWKQALEETPGPRPIFPLTPPKLNEKLYGLLADHYEKTLLNWNCMNRHWNDMSNVERVLTSQYQSATLLRRGRNPAPERPQHYNALILLEIDRQKLDEAFGRELNDWN